MICLEHCCDWCWWRWVEAGAVPGGVVTAGPRGPPLTRYYFHDTCYYFPTTTATTQSAPLPQSDGGATGMPGWPNAPRSVRVEQPRPGALRPRSPRWGNGLRYRQDWRRRFWHAAVHVLSAPHTLVDHVERGVDDELVEVRGVLSLRVQGRAQT